MRNAIVFINICIVAAVSMLLLEIKDSSSNSSAEQLSSREGLNDASIAVTAPGEDRPLTHISAGLAMAPVARASSSEDAEYVQKFIQEMRQMRKVSIEHAKLASQRSTRRPLKDYGSWMVQHQQQMLSDLDGLAKLQGVPVVTAIHGELTETLAELDELHGRKFDTKYIRRMIRSLKTDLQNLERASYSLDPDVQVFATRYMSVTKDNLAKLQQIRRAY